MLSRLSLRRPRFALPARSLKARLPRRNAFASGLVAVVAMFAAVLIGGFVALFGSAAGYAAFVYFGAAIVATLGLVKVLTTDRVIAFPVLAIMIGLPLMGHILPPRRFGLTLFDILLIVLAVRLAWIALTRYGKSAVDFEPMPNRIWLLIGVLLLPSVVFSQFRRDSLTAFVMLGLVYLFYVLLLHEAREPLRRDLLLKLFIIATLVLGGGLLFERLTGLNIALQTINANQASFTEGVLVRRMRGFFGDPQKAAQFLACAAVFLSVLLARGRFKTSGLKWLASLAILAGTVGILLTASRGALLAGLIVLPLSLLLFNRWYWFMKLGVLVLFGVLVVAAAQVPLRTLTSALPQTVAVRIAGMEESAEFRQRVWLDTWEMFRDHPAQGIGLGSFGPYMERELRTTGRYLGFGRGASIGYVPDQPESGYFKILYEGGILGSLAALLLAAATLARLLRAAFSPEVSADQKSEAIAAFAALVVFAITFVTLFTLSDKRVAILFAFMLAMIWSPTTFARGAPANATPGPG